MGIAIRETSNYLNNNIQTWEDTDNGKVSSKKKGFVFYKENFTNANLQAVETYWDSIPKTFYWRRWGSEKWSYGETNLNIHLTYPDENGKGERNI